ncbi:AsnC family protein [Actinokineospora guangxiensis]|uniref:AsnC family protein n=1 Tax=Actinokineospora guangxiensis TaxID=1490288 RepID=A0ABW0EQS1_9PSEU
MTDAVDARLLGVVAEMGRAAVHEVAARLGMDPREAASRLVALSASGVPLLVGVECDPNGVRAALARMQPQPGYGYPPGYQQQPVQQQPVQQQPAQYGAYPYQGPPQGGPSGPHQVAPPSGQHAVRVGPPSQPFPAQQPPQQQLPPPDPGDPINVWGPPQSSTWARGDQPPGGTLAGSMDRTQPAARPHRRTGKAGEALETEGLEGERLSIKLIEVVDPADYLFTAAGYRLQEGERSIVVHTELVNRGAVKFGTLPDLYLVLVTDDGREITKAPVSLSSRPPHRIGVAPGETAGGHTVYVVPEETVLTSVRWSPRPDEESRTLTWAIEN